MKKTHIRDYATEAFRFYARVGGADTFKRSLWDAALEAQAGDGPSPCPGSPTEAAVMRAQAALDEAVAAVKDLEAVERVFGMLDSDPRGECIKKAVKLVYMVEPHREVERGEISERVIRASHNIPACERSIYGWLGKARYLFAAERGLRI